MSQEPLGHLVEMEPKETWVAREKMGPRDHLELTERKEQRESLGSRVPPDKKESEGNKGDSGTPRLASHMNWKECAWKKGDGKDSGLIYVSEQYPCVIRKNMLLMNSSF